MDKKIEVEINTMAKIVSSSKHLALVNELSKQSKELQHATHKICLSNITLVHNPWIRK